MSGFDALPPAPVADLDVFACPLDGVRLVEASAGTGKTWNICGLYLRLVVESGRAVDEILVVTFTRAATAELKSRVRERIVGTLAFLDGGAGDAFATALVAAIESRGTGRELVRARLDAALARFDEAAIFTIHGYCQRALAETPFAAGLPFALELAEDDLELRLEATRDFWRREIATDDCPAELGELLVERGDSPERWAVLLGRYGARPLAERRWPDPPPAPTAGDRDAQRTRLAAAFAEALALWGDEPQRTLADGRAALRANSYRAEGIDTGARGWTAWLAGGDALAPLPKAGKLDLFAAGRIADALKKGCTAPDHPFFDAADRLLTLRESVVAALDAARLALLRRFLEETEARLRATKRERRQIAFDDILFNVYGALVGGETPWLAASLHRRHPVALIDEFQDTDPLQFEIFRRIYADCGRHGALFLVGDPKQAIYSFRNADLHTYLAARGRTDAQYTLRHNQRSVEGLIGACNALFAANPAAFVLDGLRYEQVAVGAKPREPFVDASGGASAPLQVWRIPADDAGAPMLRADAMRAAAAATAAEAARLIGEGAAGRIMIGDRRLAPGDIAVLVKSHAQGARMRDALAAVGVGAVELSQQSVFHSVDAEELERVLLAIVEPSKTSLLAAALATGLMGLDAAALDALAADEARLLDAISRFAALRELWHARGAGVMLRRWIAQEGVARRLIARDDGERRLTNLLHLCECLHEAGAEHPSPDALLRWFASRRADPGCAEATQLRLESDRNLVQIVTIHRSKGLEYGIVFCPFLWDGHPGRADDGEGCSYHDDDGRPVLDFRPDAKDDATIKASIRRERDAEFLRLVYVALTRAVHRGYLVAGCYGTKTSQSVSTTQSTRSLLNWLVAGHGFTHDGWRENKLEPVVIDAAWHVLAKRAAPHVAIIDLPMDPGVPLVAAEPSVDALRVPAPPARIAPPWQIGSFSALSHGAGGDAAALDHDARAAQPPAGPPPSLGPDDVLRFPRGPSAGDCIHAAFERVDFADAATVAPAVAAALAAHPQRSTEPGQAARHARMLERLVADVLATPLPDGIVLGRVPKSRQLVELGFHLPAPRLAADALNDWLARAGYVVPRLAFGALAGYLKGYIDLVFEHDGRFYILDWKSNHLGYGPEDYGPARVADAMASHGYHLQHLLYAVALHRHLGRTLPGHDIARHFGGVLYLFVRGVRPDWRLDGAPAGVYFHRPDDRTIAGLDRLIAGKTKGAGR